MNSASNDSGDYQFADLSNVVSNISLQVEGYPVEDELVNIPLYILCGTLNGSERDRLTANRNNLDTQIRAAEYSYTEYDYTENHTSSKEEAVFTIRNLLFHASNDDLKLLSLDTINALSTLIVSNNHYSWETTGRIRPEESNEQISKSIKSLLLEKFNAFGKSIISGANDAIIAAIGQKMKSDIAAGITSTVISDAQFRSLPNYQLSVLLSQWTNAHVTIPNSILAKLSVTQIGNLSPTTLAMFLDTANLSQAPDSFIIGLGYIAKELNHFSAHMQNIGWWSSGDTPRRSFPLSATQLQSFTLAQQILFLSPWTDDARNPPVSAFILQMLSDTQLASLDDSVYQHLKFDEVNAILPRIPVSKINLLNPAAFEYPTEADALAGSAWPSASQLAVMSVDQVNALFKIFCKSAALLNYEVNPNTHLIERVELSHVVVMNPARELFRSTIMALPGGVLEKIGVTDTVGVYITGLPLDDDLINIIHSLPLGLVKFLSDEVIDFIARDDELSLDIGSNIFFNQAEFSMLTVAQVKIYISSYFDEARLAHSGNDLPLAILNALSPKQVQSLTTDQFNSISANTLALLSDAFVMGMTENQIELLISSNKLQYLRLDQIPFIDTNVIANLGTRLSNFTTDQLNSLRQDQIRAIGTAVPTSEADALMRPYLNGAQVQAFIDSNLVPDQYAFLTKDMFAHLTQTQMQKISPELIPYISKDIIAQLETNGKLNNFTNDQIWNLSNEQINAAFPYGQAVSNPLRLSAQVGLAFDQMVYSALEISNNGLTILTTLTPQELIAIPPNVLAEFSNAQLAQLTNAQIFNLSLDQINALGQKKYAVLAKTPGPAIALNATQIGALNADQINALTAQTIGSFSVAQFKALLHNTVVPFTSLDPSLLQFVDASVLNALNSNELDMWSQDQISALSVDSLGNLSDYNKEIVRAIMGIQDDSVSGARLLQSVSSPLDGIYGGFNLPAVPLRSPAVIINKNTSLAWTQDKINQVNALKAPDKNVQRPDYYVSNVDLARTYLTPYRDVTWMRYILLDNLYSSAKYDVIGENGSVISRFDGNKNSNAYSILQSRKYLQVGRSFGSILLMMSSVDVFKNAWNLRNVRPLNETVGDFLVGIGWIASGIQVPWGAFWNASATTGYGGARAAGGYIFEPLATYYGINRPFYLKNSSTVAPTSSSAVVPASPSNVAASIAPVEPAVQGNMAGAGVGIVVDGRTTYTINLDIAKATEKIGALTTQKMGVISRLKLAVIESRTLKDSFNATRLEIKQIDDQITAVSNEVISLDDVGAEARRDESLLQLRTRKLSLTDTLTQSKKALEASLTKTQKIGTANIYLNRRISAIKGQLSALNNEILVVQAVENATEAAEGVRPPTPVTMSTSPTTEIAAVRSKTIKIGKQTLTFDKKLKIQGMNKGGWVFMLANVMGAVNGAMNVINGYVDLKNATTGEAKSDANMRIFTGFLSFAGGVSLFIGDNIDALADASNAQKFLGARFTNIALAIGYVSQTISTLYKEWATYGRNQNGWRSAALKTGTIAIRITLMCLNWLARTNFWGSIITTAALTVVPFLLDNAVEYYLSQNYLDDLRDTLIREGRTTEADSWIPVLKAIEKHASLWGQLDIATYKQNQLNDLSVQMLENNEAKLKSVLSQQKAATMLRTADGLAFLTDIINGMISSNSNTNTTDAQVSDFYILEMGTASKKNYYVTQTGLNDKKFGYVLQSHLSVNSLLSPQTPLSTTFASTATTEQLSSYFSVDTSIGNDLDTTGGSTVLTDQASGNSVTLVQLVFNQAYYDLAQKNFVVDASTTTKNMIFTVATHTTILAGSGFNTFNVDQSSVDAGSYEIVAKDIFANEINFTNHKEAEANNINLDNFRNMRVVQRDVNYGAGNTATGSLYGQYYVAGFGGKNTITMTGGGANVVANGRGNTVTLGGNNNTAYINLLSDMLQNYEYQAMARGSYIGSANTTNNAINFSGTTVAGGETFNVDINGSLNIAAIKNAGVVVDAINFTNFQQLEGSNSGSIINITGNTQLSSLILNDASAVGKDNVVNLQDVSGLAIVSSGKSIITINESNPENNKILGNTNYVYLQGAGGSEIYANANTITGARLESASDSITFAQDARFNLLEVGNGTHTINFIAHNASQIDSGVDGLIRMVNNSGDSHVIVQDESRREIIEDTLMIQLVEESHVDDYNVTYRYNERNNKNEVYFESTSGTKSLTYLTVNTDITTDSYAEIVVLGAANTASANTYYDSDINTIIEAITELTISNAVTAVQFSGYTGYSFSTVLDKVLQLNSYSYVEQDNSYTLAIGEYNLKLLDNYDDVTKTFSSYSGTGNSNNNRIVGSDGNNTLDGGAGADVLIGGDGDDTYIVDNAGDVVVEYGDQGTDTVKSSVNYTLTNNVENLTLIGSNNINATGNAGDNVLMGNSGNNSLIGGAGNDTLIGTSGSDIDTLIGGTGNDVYVINALAASNVVVEGVGGGTDTVQTTLASFSLSANVENLVYAGTTAFNGVGNVLDNIFSVSILSSAVQSTFDGNDGKDTIDYSNATTAITVTLNGSSNGTATGAVNDILKNIENVIGGLGNDTITGDSQDNLLVGGSGNNSIIGGVGNDTLKGGSDNDILDGGVGTDTVDYSDAIEGVIVSLALTTAQINVGSGTDTLSNIENIIGSGYRDKLTGSAGNNILDGGAGNDTLDGGTGNDTLIGGTGNDVYIVDSTADVIVESTSANGGIDTIKTTLTTLTLTSSYQGIENLSYQGTNNFTGTGNGNDNVLTGNVGNDTLIAGDGDDTLIGGAGNNSLIGGAGNDVYKVDSIGDVIVESGGTDTIETTLIALTLTSSYQDIENLRYQGINNFTGTGNSNSNVLTGNEGDDTLDGAAGNDTLIGGKGNDTYIVNDVSETITERNNEGIDTVRTTLATYTLANVDNVENITYVGAASAYLIGNVLDNVFFGTTFVNTNGDDTYDGGFGNDTVNYSNISIAMNINLVSGTATGAGTDKLINIENIIGGAGNDLITGNATDNLLYGGAGNNSLVGGVGNDVLESGVGNDTLNGGADNDTASYRRATAGVTVNLATGVATGFGTDKLIDIENITGSDFADTLTGSAGENILDGGAGADNLSGGLGNDTYIIDNTADQINEVSITGSGIDTVKIKANVNTYTLGLNLENLIYMGTDVFTGIGNGLNNVLSGSSDNDTLSGLGGDDTLDGGLGNDSLVGGDGNDVYIVDSTDDVIVEATTANAGTDLVRTTLSRLVLAENVENLIYSGVGSFVGIGNQLANVITGGLRDDTLDGGAGSDTLIGGAGNDVYIVNTSADVIVESTDGGNDTVETSLLFTLDLSLTAYANVENISYTGTGAFNGKGNAGDNVFSGGIGNDTFDGGGGTDTIDYSQLETAVIVTLINSNGSATGTGIGTDTLINIKNVVGGSGRDIITGTDGDNLLSGGIGSDTINGGNGNDTLDGGYGEDSLWGGNGNDIYIVDNTNDVLVEIGGIDTVVTSVLYQLDLRNYQNIENLQYIGVDSFVGIGDQYNNVLTGGVGDDSLDGVSGADTFIGGNGDDIYYINSTDDVVIEATTSDAGNDMVITALASFTLFDNVEYLTYTGTANFNAKGNRGDNVLVGDTGNDSLNGAAGNDTLVGGDGNDSLMGGFGNDILDGGSGNDTADYSQSQNSVTVNLINMSGTATGQDIGEDTLTNIENIIGGSGNDTIVGSGANNVLNGGTGNDSLVGGIGNDIYIVDSTGDIVIEESSAGTDSIQTTLANFSLSNLNHQFDNIENLVYTGTTAFNGAGNSLDNTFSVSILSSAVQSTFDGNDGKDTIDYSNAITAITVTLNGSSNGTATGAVNDILKNIENVIGGFGNDTIIGDNQDNLLVGGSGNDSIIGGVGNDTLRGGSDNDILDGGVGTDTVDYSDAIEGVIVSLALTTAQITVGSGTDTLSNIENIIGSGYSDKLTGSAGNNVLDGGAGNDTLDGGTGNDTLIGGTGNDVYIVDSTADVIVESTSANGGIDTIKTTLTTLTFNSSYQGIENLSYQGTNNFTGTGNGSDNVLTGNVGNDILIAGAGDDTLIGGAGNNTLSGGMGNDVYKVDSTGDVIAESGGIDTIETTLIALALTSSYQDIENLRYQGTNNFTGTGNSNDNVLTGNEGDDTLDGAVGNDTLIGGKGNDTYIVNDISKTITERNNEGIDTVRTTLAQYTLANVDNVENITYVGTASASLIGNVLDNVFFGTTIVNANGNDTYDGGVGNDTVNYSNISIAMNINLASGTATGAGTDKLINIENIIGGAGNDLITGNATDNLLYGGAGNNTLVGGVGNDVLESGTGDDTLDGGADIDTASYRRATAGVTVNLATGVATGFGTDKLIAIENITGSDFADNLTGSAGDNILDGSAGADSLSGGLGNDTYIIDNTADQINEDSVTGSGIDTVKIKANLNTYTLGLNLENLIYIGTGAFTGIGNGLNNVLSGSSGNDTLSGLDGDDTLDGGLGNDSLVGGNGNDIYIVDNTNDVLVEVASGGIDTVSTSTLYLLDLRNYQNIENLQYIGVGNFVGIGDQYNNVLTGGVGNDTLDGVSGADTFIGGNGDDIYYLNSTDDVVIEATTSAAGNDTIITALASFTLFDNVENLIYTGTANFNATGNRGDNLLAGGSANDTLSGAGGNDTLLGGDGIDSLIGGDGNDILEGDAGNDTLIGGDGIDSLIGGDGNDILEGDAGNDTLIGGAGNDIYNFAQTGGLDTIIENDITSGNADILNFMDNTAKEQLWFTHVGDNLEVSIIGTTDKVVISNWYLGDQYKVETIKTNQSTLAATAVTNLVNAMALVTQPATGVTTLPSTYTSIITAINAAWH